MKKFVAFTTSYNTESALNINIEVLEDPADLAFVQCGGYIESSDIADLYTPAALMVQKLTGSCDEELVDNVVAAFRKILTPRPTVSINGEYFA